MAFKFKKEIHKKDFRVTIFGSARIKPNSKEYKQIYTIGKMLGKRGMDLITGGGPGLMEAASKGHAEGMKLKKTKAHTIGLAIKIPKEQKVNKSVKIVKTFKHFSERLDNFMLLSNAIIVAPGGVGTLLELFYSWQLVQTKQICNIPIILLGEQWKSLINWLEKWPLRKKEINEHDLNMLFYAKNCKEAIKMIDVAYKEYISGNKNYCLNYKKYQLF